MSDTDPPQADSGAPRDEPSAAQGSPHVTHALLGDLTGLGEFANRYEVESEIARGGMGAIYRVYDRKLRRRMAMKVMMARGSSDSHDANTLAEKEPRMLSRFLEEAQITGQIDHPGIVPVHEMGLDAEGRVFFTMKLVKGRDFRQILDLVHAGEEGWTLTRALNVILRVCESMAFAHTKGVLHRDLKPSNIMVGRFGETYVMDWGLARVMGREDLHDTRLTLSDSAAGQASIVESLRHSDHDSDSQSPLTTLDGDVVGTPSYMAPEQALGLLDAVGPTADVYSVGCLLYHLLGGHPPYVPSRGTVSAIVVLRMLIEGPPTPIENRNLPPELIAICHKALERETHDRYQSMEALGNDLRAFLEGRVVGAYKRGAVAEFKKWVARNRGVAAGIGASILLGVLGLASVLLVQERSRRDLAATNEELEVSRAAALANESAAREAKELADASAREAREQSYVARLRAASASLRVHEASEAERQLDACPPELRRWEWRLLRNQTDPSLLTLNTPTRAIHTVLYGPRTGRLLGLERDGSLYLWSPEGDQLAKLNVGRSARCIAIHAEETSIAVGYAEGLVRTFELGSDQPLSEYTVGPSDVECVALSHDGAWIATGDNGGSVRVLAVADGSEVWSERHGREVDGQFLGSPIFGVAFTQDNRSLVYTSHSRARCRKTSSWDERFSLPQPIAMFTTMGVSPDGRRIALGNSDGSIRLLSARRGTVWHTLEEHSARVRSLAFSADGGKLVSASDDGTVRVWDAQSGSAIGVLSGHRGDVLSAAFRPDGRRIATGGEDTAVRIWHERYSGGAFELADGRWRGIRGAREMAASPKGEQVAVAVDVGAIRVLDLRTEAPLFDAFARPLLDERSLESSVRSLSYSADGRTLAAASAGYAYLWNAENGVLLDAVRPPDRPVRAVAFHPVDNQFVTGCEDGTLVLWDAEKARPLWQREYGEETVGFLVFPPGGDTLVAAFADRTVRILDTETGALLQQREFGEGRGRVARMALDPAGERLAVAFDQYLVPGLFVGPKRVAIAIWDLAADEIVTQLPGHESQVTGLFFDAAGERLVSASGDRTLRVWDPSSGVELLALRRHEGGVRAAIELPGGSRMLSCDDEGAFLLWDSRPLEEQVADERVLEVEQEAGHMLRSAVFFSLFDDLPEDVSDEELRKQLKAGNAWIWSFQPAVVADIFWGVVRVPTLEQPECERLLLGLRALAALDEDTDYDLLRGASAVRCGDFTGGTKFLMQAPAADVRERILQQAFLALARASLGDRAQAAQSLGQARSALAEADESTSREVRSLLREVEAAVNGS